jgi:hypothetical protein
VSREVASVGNLTGEPEPGERPIDRYEMSAGMGGENSGDTPSEAMWDESGGTSESFGLESLFGRICPPPAAVPADWLIGVTVGGMQIVRLIATGGMGRVYEAIQE